MLDSGAGRFSYPMVERIAPSETSANTTRSKHGLIDTVKIGACNDPCGLGAAYFFLWSQWVFGRVNGAVMCWASGDFNIALRV